MSAIFKALHLWRYDPAIHASLFIISTRRDSGIFITVTLAPMRTGEKKFFTLRISEKGENI